VNRLLGMASTRWIWAEWVGTSNAAYRKKEWSAVSRRFRLRTVTPYPHRPLDAFEDLAEFFSAEDDRNPMRHFGPRHVVDRANLNPKHVTIEKQHGAQRLILRR
jgi:hypothetical protein